MLNTVLAMMATKGWICDGKKLFYYNKKKPSIFSFLNWVWKENKLPSKDERAGRVAAIAVFVSLKKSQINPRKEHTQCEHDCIVSISQANNKQKSGEENHQQRQMILPYSHKAQIENDRVRHDLLDGDHESTQQTSQTVDFDVEEEVFIERNCKKEQVKKRGRYGHRHGDYEIEKNTLVCAPQRFKHFAV